MTQCKTLLKLIPFHRDHYHSLKSWMSLQVNLASADIAKAYQDVLNANGIDWCLFTYEKGSNDLKVQSTGDGGLEELEEEFSDARCVHRKNTSYLC